MDQKPRWSQTSLLQSSTLEFQFFFLAYHRRGTNKYTYL